ncbi:MAG: hypothetical protein WAX07_00335 [Candidatus Altiarchaeia archaeon]
MNKILNDFYSLLKERLERRVYTTEDSVRYTFFVALLKQGFNPYEIILEDKHSEDNKAEVDLHIEPDEKRKGLVIEFKYHRGNRGGKNLNKSKKAGEIFEDIRRLAQFKSTNDKYTRLFIYITNEQMMSYLKRKRNNLVV